MNNKKICIRVNNLTSKCIFLTGKFFMKQKRFLQCKKSLKSRMSRKIVAKYKNIPKSYSLEIIFTHCKLLFYLV